MNDAPRLYHAPARPDATPAVSAHALDILADLNDEQRAAALHGDGPLLVIAGAGTGKTRTLVHRMAHLIARGVRPERILLLTFTRRAASEMLNRAERLVGADSRLVHGGTFHGTAHRLLRRFGSAAGLPSDFTIMDQGDSEDLMQLSRSALGLATVVRRKSGGDGAGAARTERFPSKETLHAVYSRHVNTDIPVADIVRDDYPAFVERVPDIGRIYADYTERKGARNLVDYDDLLLFWAALVEAEPVLAERVAGLYEHVLVDEYQDTNALQARILRGMCRSHRNLTVVGDDAQGIYSFRGANHRNILDFPAQFPGTRVVTLERNYRSTGPILDVANTVIGRAAERYEKQLWPTRGGGEVPWLVACRDEDRQTAFVADRILDLHEQEGVPLREIAVLVRAGYMSASLEIELAARRIPFEKWGGLKFLESAHVKDVLAFLRLAENPRDEVSWYRVLRLLPGVGDVTARAAIDTLAAAAWDPDALSRFTPPAKAKAGQAGLVAMLRDLRRASGGVDGAASGPAQPPGADADIARVRTVYDAILRERYDRPDPRIADLDQLQTIAAGYPGRSAFLSTLALEPPASTQDLAGGGDGEDDVLVISTVHSAKGKEWTAVFLIWAVDGWFPSTRALDDADETEEERRLMYVALTRARDHLLVTYPLNTYGSRRGADYSLDQLSRFLDRDVRALMQRVTPAADAPAAPPDESALSAPLLDLRALLRGRFGGR